MIAPEATAKTDTVLAKVVTIRFLFKFIAIPERSYQFGICVSSLEVITDNIHANEKAIAHYMFATIVLAKLGNLIPQLNGLEILHSKLAS